MSKRATSPSAASPCSAAKRVKTEPDQEDGIKPDIKPKLEDYTPSVSSISLDWLKHTDPEKLRTLLLEACGLYPAFDARLNDAIADDSELLGPDGDVDDFKIKMAEFSGLIPNWYEGENWQEIVFKLENLVAEPDGALLSKLNSLRALETVISDIWQTIRGHAADYAEGESPSLMWKKVRQVLKSMTDEQRRKHIDAGLVKDLDHLVFSAETRSLYGQVGRDVGDNEFDGSDGSDEEETEEGSGAEGEEANLAVKRMGTRTG